MEEYLKETEFATSELIKLVFQEEKEIQKLLSEIRVNENIYNQFIAMEYDLEGVSPARLQHTYIQAMGGTSQAYIHKKIEELKKSLKVKDASLKVLCGALLQIGKQGISIVHGNLENCPDLKPSSNKHLTESLKDFIWWGRNQSLHYEEGNFRKGVTVFFKLLRSKYGDAFALEKNSNLAKEIVTLLKWTSYESYKMDMLSLEVVQ